MHFIISSPKVRQYLWLLSIQSFWWPKYIRVFHALCEEGNIFLILPGQYFFNIARTLCDQSFNIDLRLRYVVRIQSSENRTMPRPP